MANIKTGRPRKNQDEKRSVLKAVRLKPSEVSTLTKLAEKAGMDESEYLREAALSAVVKARPSLADRQEAGKWFLALGQIGTNINQIAFRLNSGHTAKLDVIETAMMQLEAVCQQIENYLADDYQRQDTRERQTVS
jgi:hypothetical protein